jgi:hypothetical protein
LKSIAFELPGGIFVNVECLCVANKIPLVRSSGSCSGVFGPARVVFDCSQRAQHYDLNESDEVVLTRRETIQLGSFGSIRTWLAAADFTPPPVEIVKDTIDLSGAPETDHG